MNRVEFEYNLKCIGWGYCLKVHPSPSPTTEIQHLIMLPFGFINAAATEGII